MARDHKSGLGLVDGGKLVANLSVSDLRWGGTPLVGVGTANRHAAAGAQANPTRSPPLSHRGLTPEEFPLLLLPAGEFVAVRNGVAGVTKEEALSGKRVPGASEGNYAAVFASSPVVTLKTTDTFEKVGSCRGQVL